MAYDFTYTHSDRHGNLVLPDIECVLEARVTADFEVAVDSVRTAYDGEDRSIDLLDSDVPLEVQLGTLIRDAAEADESFCDGVLNDHGVDASSAFLNDPDWGLEAAE